METEYKNQKLEQEFSNPVYDVIKEAIQATAQKHNYKKYDIVRLIDALYNWDYAYLTNDDDYRMQARLLDEYFTKEYNHRLISFELVKSLRMIKDTKDYDVIITDIASLEPSLKKGKEVPTADLNLISKPLEQDNYDELMKMIEKEPSLRHSIAIIYDKLMSKALATS